MAHCKKNCISLFLTEDCNLSCKYCYCKSDRKKSKPMNINFIKCAIDDFYKENRKIYLRFFGDGEPTLQMNIIRETTKYVRMKDKKSVIELQTNGYFSESICEWLGENMDIIWISCDGPQDIQDYYRPIKSGENSSYIVEKNVKYLTSINELTVGIRATIGSKNVNRQNELVDYFSSLGVNYIYTDLIFADSENLYFEGNLEEDISVMHYAKQLLKTIKYAEEKNIFYGSFFTMNFDEPSNISCRACLPAPHLTLDGYVSCCDLVYSNQEDTNLIYGKYDMETNSINYDQDKIDFIRSRTVENLPECNDCEIKYNCAGGCIGEALYEKGSIFKIKTQNCEAIRYLAKELGVNKGRYPIFHP